MAQTHSPTRSVDESPSGAAGRPVWPSTLISAMSVSRIGADHVRPQRPAVGQLHGDPLGALDHVIVRQDAAVGVDDEAAAGAAARRIAVARRSTSGRPSMTAAGVAAVGRAASAARDVASMFTTAGFRRSTTSAKLTSDADAGPFATRAGRARLVRGPGHHRRLRDPAGKIAPTRNATIAVRATVTSGETFGHKTVSSAASTLPL